MATLRTVSSVVQPASFLSQAGNIVNLLIELQTTYGIGYCSLLFPMWEWLSFNLKQNFAPYISPVMGWLLEVVRNEENVVLKQKTMQTIRIIIEV